MTFTVPAYAATSANEPLAPFTVERRDVGPKDVRIDIKYSGICHSDIHTARSEWGPANYPVVVGHEIAGVVAEVGADVTRHKVGDRVGVGCMVDSCRECENCLAGDEQYCRKGNTGTYNSVTADGGTTQGGYAAGIVVTEDFVLSIPEGVELDVAAPLLCAGITTYSPLRHWNAGPGKKVAVVGLGGLGHMAVKIAHAMGAEVTVLSQSLKKQEDGLKLGADHYFATSDPDTFAQLDSSFDLIVNTVSARIDVTAYLRLLKVDGTMVNVGAPRTRSRSTRSRSSVAAAPGPARTSVVSARPRRCSTSAPSTTSAPRSRSSVRIRSTRPTSGCSPPTCATAS